jgi:hypothetical protein
MAASLAAKAAKWRNGEASAWQRRAAALAAAAANGKAESVAA